MISSVCWHIGRLTTKNGMGGTPGYTAPDSWSFVFVFHPLTSLVLSDGLMPSIVLTSVQPQSAISDKCTVWTLWGDTSSCSEWTWDSMLWQSGHLFLCLGWKSHWFIKTLLIAIIPSLQIPALWRRKHSGKAGNTVAQTLRALTVAFALWQRSIMHSRYLSPL